jgi:hypothetical protein
MRVTVPGINRSIAEHACKPAPDVNADTGSYHADNERRHDSHTLTQPPADAAEDGGSDENEQFGHD